MVKEPDKLLNGVRNAGAIFAGYRTPAVIGDYWAGPSHVLPTGGTARFSSGLSVLTFLKRTSYISFSGKNLREDGLFIQRLAETEGLTSHGDSIRSREIPVGGGRKA